MKLLAFATLVVFAVASSSKQYIPDQALAEARITKEINKSMIAAQIGSAKKAKLAQTEQFDPYWGIPEEQEEDSYYEEMEQDQDYNYGGDWQQDANLEQSYEDWWASYQLAQTGSKQDDFTGYTNGNGKFIATTDEAWNAREFYIWQLRAENKYYQYLDSKGKVFKYGDKAWSYAKYEAYLYRDYGYTDNKTGKYIKYSDKAFNWNDYYAAQYDITYSYTRKSDGKKVKYSDSDFSWAEYDATKK